VALAFDLAAAFCPEVVVEEVFEGRDYRVVVVDGKVVAASERVAAHVVGDGVPTVGELIDIENRNPLRGDGHEKPLTRIKVDALVEAFLRRWGRSLSDVPPAGERVFLRQTANLSTGGTAREVTDEVHPDVARLCERAAALSATLGGAAKFQAANAVACLAACRALGQTREQCAAGLLSFHNGRDNQGRLNLYRVGPGHVVVDYAHNPGAFAALSDLRSA
jgi:hypothetical protein